MERHPVACPRWSSGCDLRHFGGNGRDPDVAQAGRSQAATGNGRNIGTILLRRRGLLLLAFGFLNLDDLAGGYPTGLRRFFAAGSVVDLAKLAHGVADRAGLCSNLSAFCSALFDYDRNWDLTTMTYHQLWTPVGLLLRNLFYDGFRSVFPLTGLLIFRHVAGTDGLVQLRDVPRKAIDLGLGLVMATWAMSHCVLNWLSGHPQLGLDHVTANALFGLQSMPPPPIFLLNAMGCALLVIGASTLIERRWQDGWGVRGPGRDRSHELSPGMWRNIVIGLGGVIVLGWTRATHWQALGAASGFFAIAVTTSLWWRRRFSTGPLEFILRKVG